MSKPDFCETIFTPEEHEPDAPSLRATIPRPRKLDRNAGWVALILVALAAFGYAVQLAYRDPPPAPAPAPIATEPPSVAVEPAPLRKLASPPRPATRPTAPVAARSQPSPFSAAPPVTREPEPKAPVDPITGFETGDAFDNPPSPGQYGRRGSGVVPGEPSRRPR